MKQFLRLIQILSAIWKEKLDVHFLGNPLRFRRADSDDRGEALRRTLESLGPVFIKLGQALSTRPDLFPPDIVSALSKLQDRVEPFDNATARAVIEAQLGQPIEALFSEFSASPMAAASIAQVHPATLTTGEDVVVKVLRPSVEKRVAKDIALMFVIAKLVQRFFAEGKRLRPVEVVDEFQKTAEDELDLMREAANCAMLGKHFEHNDLLYVPKIYWDLCRERVVVMERIYGHRVSEIEFFQEQGVNMEVLARKGVEIFFTQVFHNNFFHADMHPGNVYVDISDPNDPSYIALDFGIMGTLTHNDRNYLAENLLGFFRRDYRKVAELHIQSGWVPSHVRAEELEMAIRTVAEPIFGKPLKDISFGVVLLRLFSVARRYEMIVQPQLVLLQKTLLNIEGLGRELYPDLDLWATAKPFIERWIDEQKGIRALGRGLKDEAPGWAEMLPTLPRMTHQYLSQRPKMDAELAARLAQIDQSLNRKRWPDRLLWLAIGAALAAIVSQI
ncbi:MAG: ubiquinone biosynthesis regulatory protein kinase UbiB [Gammaproteobacteria bacterium]|nr:ubiquinone biosynthesis regulatory protein kinase UbiB [Gammaproteobacteria bacterium]